MTPFTIRQKDQLNLSMVVLMVMLNLASIACSSSSEIQESTSIPNELFDEFVLFLDNDERNEIRELAQAYVENWQTEHAVRGISIITLKGNLAFVGVDVFVGSERKTLNLVARRFYTLEGKSSYWKVDPLSPELSRALSGFGVKRLEGSDVQDYTDSREQP